MVFCFILCSAGGLVTAVAPVVIDCKGQWVGWTGLDDFDEVVDSIPESDPEDKAPTAGLLSKQVIQNFKINASFDDFWIKSNGSIEHNLNYLLLLTFQAVPVAIDPKLFDLYYNGCCNETYWPLFHSMPDKAIFNTDYWKVSLISHLLNIEGFDILN